MHRLPYNCRWRIIDTPPGMNPRGCSGYVCPNGLRWRLRGLPGRTALSPEPQDVEGGIMIAMQTRPTVRARMPADGEPFVHEHTAARTRLAGERRRHRYDCLSSLSRFERQDAQEGAPPSVRNGLRQVVIPQHVGRLQVFVIDRVVLLDQGKRRL